MSSEQEIDYFDEDDYEGDYEEEKQNMFQNEAAVFERVGLPTANLGTIISARGGKFEDLQKIINRVVKDPTDRFLLYVESISQRLINQRDFPLDTDDIIYMMDHAREIREPGAKNATAYILGYMASKGGKKNITPEHIDKIFTRYLPYVEDDSVKTADVIRYMRLWQNTTK